ncbi:uncharacterized protein LOC134541860 [Bacillus rossius redtenbacheri]|uniref:uncharacterized protein LOC134541860 n=1 Tax=Bacillus rossius redtenbacheri TaxID=93214 RepID=UPI002FDCBA64
MPFIRPSRTGAGENAPYRRGSAAPEDCGCPGINTGGVAAVDTLRFWRAVAADESAALEEVTANMKACVAVLLLALVAVCSCYPAEPEPKEGLKGSEAVYLAAPYASYYGTPLAYSGYHVPAVPAVYSYRHALAPLPAVAYLR